MGAMSGIRPRLKLAAWWLRAFVSVPVSGCGGSENGGVVQVRDPQPMDAAQDAPDGALADAAQGDAAIDPHGPEPLWPQAEQTLEVRYQAEAVRAALTLAANPQKLDVHFNVDATGSFGGEIATLQRELSRSVIPRLRARVADTQIGVSRFADFPFLPFGQPSSEGRADVPFELLCPVTDSLARVTNALTELKRSLGDGADVPEAGAEALYQIATGQGFELNDRFLVAPFDAVSAAADGGGTVGGVGFRNGALRVVLHITDAISHTPSDYARVGIDGVHGLEAASTALNAIGVRVLGINSCDSTDSHYGEVREQLSELALGTGAYTEPARDQCSTGIAGAALPTYRGLCPWVFDVAADGSGLTTGVVDAVVALLDAARYSEVHVETGADPLGFIQRIELEPLKQPTGVDAPGTADRRPTAAPDGVLDSYVGVTSRQRLGFSVVVANPRIAPSDVDQMFRVSVKLVGDGVELEERLLAVRIPALPPLAADEDAGVR